MVGAVYWLKAIKSARSLVNIDILANKHSKRHGQISDESVILARGLGTRISDANEVSVASIARSILEALAAKPDWDLDATQSPHESNTLNLNSTKARKMLGWRDHFPAVRAAAWHLAWCNGEDMRAVSLKAIDAYMAVEDAAPECAPTNNRDDE